MAKSDKQRALESFLASNKKKYGEGRGAIYGHQVQQKCDVISTGSFLIDDAIGIGGLPRGRVVEIFGDEASGKTTTTILTAANALKKYPDEYVGIVDVEHALNWPYAKTLGLNDKNTVFSQPSSGEQAIDEMLDMVSSGAFSMVVMDSVAALRTKRQLEGDIGDATMAEVARLLSENVFKITTKAEQTNTLVVFINQLRTNLGAYGSPLVTTGGKAIKFAASVRLELKKREPILNKAKDPIGQVVRAIIRKNRMGVPFKEIETELFFGKGYNQFKEVIDLAIDKKVIIQAGAFYSFEPDAEENFRGKDALIQHVLDSPKVYEELCEKLRNFSAQEGLEEAEANAEKIDE